MFDRNLGFCTKGSYAGIGSRRIPIFYTRQQMKFAVAMVFMGVRLRSGAADGSDTAFEFGAKLAYDFLSERFNLPKGDYGRVMDIYLPWSGFNGRNQGSGFITSIHPEAESLTKKYHNYWQGLKPGARKMMSRNAMQVLGNDLNEKSRFIMCYTPDGATSTSETSSRSGGTGQAIRIADDLKISIDRKSVV